MLKVELHTHTVHDPEDPIPHTAEELIDRAAALGYQALAMTLHNRQLDPSPYGSYAASRGITLIPGIERTIEGRHVVLLNFSRASEGVDSFEDLARLKQREPGLVVAPHPFYPIATSLREKMDQHAGLIDAVEYNAMFTSSLNYNLKAEQWALAHGKPMVGNGDVHRLDQLGTTYSLVDAAPNPYAICAAIKAGHVKVEARPLSWWSAATLTVQLFSGDLKPGRWSRLPRLERSDWPAWLDWSAARLASGWQLVVRRKSQFVERGLQLPRRSAASRLPATGHQPTTSYQLGATGHQPTTSYQLGAIRKLE